MQHIHGTCVAIGQCGILLLGDPGSGKSDLALRLIDRGAVLVADDQVQLKADNSILKASAPANIKGLLEVRGVGLIKMQCADAVPLVLVVQLVPPEKVERLPLPRSREFLGIALAVLELSAFEASAPIKVEAAISACQDNRLQVGFLRE